MKSKILVSWSSGKDSAWMLHELRRRDDVEIVGLITSFNEAVGRVAMHGVREDLVNAQAEAIGLPLWPVRLPWPCSNENYESAMRQVFAKALCEGVTSIAFGDLFLADIRDYRERQLAGTGLEPLFPIWGTPHDTPQLAQAMIAAGFQATIACVDPRQLAAEFVGQAFDQSLLDRLPPGVDPCGERGEFHTFCHAGPIFNRPILTRVGEVVQRDGFCFADILPVEPLNSSRC